MEVSKSLRTFICHLSTKIQSSVKVAEITINTKPGIVSQLELISVSPKKLSALVCEIKVEEICTWSQQWPMHIHVMFASFASDLKQQCMQPLNQVSELGKNKQLTKYHQRQHWQALFSTILNILGIQTAISAHLLRRSCFHAVDSPHLPCKKKFYSWSAGAAAPAALRRRKVAMKMNESMWKDSGCSFHP